MSRFADLADHIRQHSKELGAKPRIGIDIPGLSVAFSLGKEFSSDSKTFTDEITGSPSLLRSASRLGGIGLISGLEFAVNNQELFSDIFASGSSPNPEGEAVNVYLYFDDGTDILDAEREKVFSGVIVDFPTIDYTRTTFMVESTASQTNKKLGTLVTGDDAASGFELPPESLGVVKPRIYGDHRTFVNANNGNNVLAADWVGSFENNFVPMVNKGGKKWLAAEHEIMMLKNDSSGAGDAVWAWIPAITRFVELNPNSWTVANNNNVDGFVIERTGDSFWDYRLPTGATARAGGTEWTNVDRLYDRSIATSSEPTVVSGVGVYDVDITFPANDISITIMSGVKLYIKGDFTPLAAGAMYVDDNNTLTFPNDSLTTHFHTHQNQLPFTSNADLETIALNYEFFSGSPTARVYEVYLRIDFDDATEYDLYWGGRGRPYERWINDRAVGDGFTEEHADHDNAISKKTGTDGSVTSGSPLFNSAAAGFTAAGVTAGDIIDITNGPGGVTDRFVIKSKNSDTQVEMWEDFVLTVASLHFDIFTAALIENGAGVVESILLNEQGLTNSDFVENSLNTASNDLSTTVLSFAIIEQIDSDDLLNSLLRTLGSTIYYDNDDDILMKTFVSGDGFSVSQNTFAAREDIWEFDPNITFTIESGVNDKLDFDEGSGDITATISAGVYTGAELAAEIDLKMDAVAAGSFTVTYSISTGKFTIADDAGTTLLPWRNGPSNATTIGPIIGFDVFADDVSLASHVSDYPVWADSFLEHPIAEQNGFSLRKSEDPIYTDITINYFLSPASQKYQSTSNATDTTHHAESLKAVFNHDYTRDATTAEFFRDYRLARLFKKFYRCLVDSTDANFSGIGVEGWDHINIRHPVLNGILAGGEETQKWLLLRESLALKSLTMSIEAEEV